MNAGCGEGQTLAVADALDEFGQPETPAVERTVRPQPAGDEGLPSEGKLRTVVDLSLRRSHAALLAELDRSTALATLAPFQKLAFMVQDRLDGILNYCRTKVPFGMVEAVNGNIKTLHRRGRGYKNLRYLLLMGSAHGSRKD
jgi:hypothetical protein